METGTKDITKMKIDTKEMVITAMFIALVFVFTAFINIQLPFGGKGGLIHLGNIPLFIAAIVFGKKTGAIVGAVGMGLFDILSGWAMWAPFTVLIVGTMGFTVGLITEKKEKHKFLWYIFGIIVACLIKVVGYYFAEVILYGNWITPFASILGNVIQVSFAGIVMLPVVGQIKGIVKKMNLM